MINKLLRISTQLTLLAIVIVVLMQIIFRYALNQPLVWSEEVARLLFIWLVFLGSALALQEQKHLTVEYFFDKFSEKWKKHIIKLQQIIIIVFLLAVIYGGVLIVSSTISMILPGSQIPMFFYHIALPVAGTLMIFLLFTKHEKKRGG
ncbi:TRAP transporter small permease [Virgibacillus sp. C22-A2]|uniref:TRAP transporter small permease n=1 Tax=Virgibacillus tibetensis TaxID=3042313 RepID=A0ABU6KE37_9BACI|nr:TRAP transporter small permease [Virgibacillus sp. C22-A2]